MSMPIAATQLPATRTTILVQGSLSETMNAETIATMTNSVASLNTMNESLYITQN